MQQATSHHHHHHHDAHHEHQHHEEHDHTHHAHHAGMIEDFKKRFWICLLLTLPILALSPMIQHFMGLGDRLRFSGDSYFLALLASIIFFYGGVPFFQGAKAEMRARLPGMMTLITVAITSAYVYSLAITFGLPGMDFFWELATLIDIMLLGHWIEMKSTIGAGDALEKLARLMPAIAHRIMPDGTIKDVPLSTLKPGDQVLVKPGEKVPADARVLKGMSHVDESMLTGESRPVEKEPQSQVVGGSINGNGALTLEVSKTGADSFLSQVIELVRQAQASKSRTQDLANQAAFWLTLAALGVGGGAFILWLIYGPSLAFALERMVSVMVVACPHALGLAVPLVVAVSTTLAAQQGLLIRNRAAFERVRKVDAVVFDKTGTLTQGAFGVTDVISLDPQLSEAELMAYAAAVEVNAEHPIARAIVKAAGEGQGWEAIAFEAMPGQGVRGRVQDKDIKIVSPGYLKDFPLEPKISALFEQGKTTVLVLIDETLKGAIALADVIRPESKEAITQLKAQGIRCMMITGDNQQVANQVAKEIELDEVFAQVLPQDKAAMIKNIQARGLRVAMVGDGVNDAPALAQADVGLAIGAGTDVAISAADIILVKSNPQDVVSTIQLAGATYRKMVENLLWAAGYNIVAIPLAAGIAYARYGIVLGPELSALLMAGSTVICALNARRLGRR